MGDRIKLDMTGIEILSTMSEGNPGALDVLLQLHKEGASIDPDGAFGGLGAILMLDTLRIYSSRIWMLYKDVCDQNIVLLMAVLRAWQLGLGPTKESIAHAIENRGGILKPSELLAAVQAVLPNFNKNTTEVEA